MLYNFNGIISAKSPLMNNRGFKFGDGVFETMRIFNGRVFNLELHRRRLAHGLKLLKIESPVSLDVFDLVEGLIHQNNILKGGKARLTIYRDSEGAYTPCSNNSGFLVEVKHDDMNHFQFSKKGLNTVFFQDYKKPVSQLSNIKTNNSLLYVLAGIYAKEQSVDDAILINESSNLVETTNANIFLRKGDKIITPPLTDGPVNGTMRQFIINNFSVSEESVSMDQFKSADEVFFTNVNGIQYLTEKEKNFSSKIIEYLNNLI